MEGIAAMVGELLDALELEDVVLVGNDTGGAIAQLVATSAPERLGALVLTSCDAFEHFPPPILKPLIAAAKAGPAYDAALQPLRTRFGRNRGFGALAHADIDDLVAEWVEPALTDRRVRNDLRRFTASLNRETTVRAAALDCLGSPSRRWSRGPPTTSSSRARMASGWPRSYPTVGSR